MNKPDIDKMVLWFYGYPGCGKTTLADRIIARHFVLRTDQLFRELRPHGVAAEGGRARGIGYGWDFLASDPRTSEEAVKFLVGEILGRVGSTVIVDGYVTRRILDQVIERLKLSECRVWLVERN